MINSPWPATVLVIGDSFSDYPAIPDWTVKAAASGLSFVNAASSGKCLSDTTGPLGADTVLASISADLAANPGADIVVWVTSAINDVLRFKQGLSVATLAGLLADAATVMDAILAAGKGVIVMTVPFTQAFIFGLGAGTQPQSEAAQTLRLAFNEGLKTYAASHANCVCYEPKWLYKDLGVLEAGNGNGFYADYYYDGLHPNANAAQGISNDIFAMLRKMHVRAAA